MRQAIIFEAPRTGYTIDQVESPMTIGELKLYLEDFEDDDLFILSHDGGYTYGSVSSRQCMVAEEHDDGWERIEF